MTDGARLSPVGFPAEFGWTSAPGVLSPPENAARGEPGVERQVGDRTELEVRAGAFLREPAEAGLAVVRLAGFRRVGRDWPAGRAERGHRAEIGVGGAVFLDQDDDVVDRAGGGHGDLCGAPARLNDRLPRPSEDPMGATGFLCVARDTAGLRGRICSRRASGLAGSVLGGDRVAAHRAARGSVRGAENGVHTVHCGFPAAVACGFAAAPALDRVALFAPPHLRAHRSTSSLPAARSHRLCRGVQSTMDTLPSLADGGAGLGRAQGVGPALSAEA
ncbi:hypothetical protein A4R44_05607 [Amycolatopsis sp. M39]|nr:hypothetical protein A4R44_05607 [Amycolatopsis sp. M39]